jgi:DNA-binding response OmpR family regulator
MTAFPKNILTFKEIKMDMEKRLVTCQEQMINLTPNEFKILHILLNNSNKTITRHMLLEKIWDIDGSFIDDNTLSVHVSALRRKLGQSGAYIKTIRGTGYTMSEGEYF